MTGDRSGRPDAPTGLSSGLQAVGLVGHVHLVLDLLLSIPFLTLVALTFTGVATLPALGSV